MNLGFNRQSMFNSYILLPASINKKGAFEQNV